MSSQNFCTECGAELEAGAAFCGQCGTPVKPPEPTPPEEIPPPPASSKPEASPSPTSTPPPTKPRMTALVITLSLVGVGLFLALIAGIGIAVMNMTRNAPPVVESSFFQENFESSPEVDGEGSIMSDPLRPGNHVWEAVGDGDLAYFFLPITGIKPGEIAEVSFDILAAEAIIYDDALEGGEFHIRVRLMNSDGNSIISGASAYLSDEWQTVTTQIEVPRNPPFELGLEIFRIEGYLLFDNITVRNSTEIAEPEPSPSEPADEPADQWLVGQEWFQEIVDGLPDGVTLSINFAESDERGWETLEVREHHSLDSGYDPNVSPLFGMFRVSDARDTVEWYDVVEDDYRPINQYLAR